ncbi:MAG: lipopolysaccharide assembly protein LapB, partial [Betaproteobacteria bacterium]|nr:lipopolysaccharide assembly protein LapB [Betaproteobacteria bacterium]
RRGEYERAIRMHQNLLDRTDLAPEQREAALFDLGLDYLKAGILDRAEDAFKRLAGGTHAAEAHRFLLDIYEQEKEWSKARDMARQLAVDTGESRGKEIAHYQCELAASESTHSRVDAARRSLDAALQVHRKCVRASIQLGDLERVAGHLDAAIEYWKRIEEQNPAYLALVAQRLLEAYRDAGRLDEGRTLLAGYLERYPSLDLLDTVFRHTLDSQGTEEAYRLVRDELRRNPTLLGLDLLLEAQIIGTTHPERRRDLELVRSLVHSHTRRLARYRCDECGFKARQFYWRCPACGGWETYPPRRTEEFDLTP